MPSWTEILDKLQSSLSGGGYEAGGEPGGIPYMPYNPPPNELPIQRLARGGWIDSVREFMGEDGDGDDGGGDDDNDGDGWNAGEEQWPSVADLIGAFPWSGERPPEETGGGGGTGGGSTGGGGGSGGGGGAPYSGNVPVYIPEMGYGYSSPETSGTLYGYTPPGAGGMVTDPNTGLPAMRVQSLDDWNAQVDASLAAQGLPSNRMFTPSGQYYETQSAGAGHGNTFIDPSEALNTAGVIRGGQYTTTPYSFVDGRPVVNMNNLWDDEGNPVDINFFVIRDENGNEMVVRNEAGRMEDHLDPLDYYIQNQGAQRGIIGRDNLGNPIYGMRAQGVATGPEDLPNVIYPGKPPASVDTPEEYAEWRQQYYDYIAGRLGMGGARPIAPDISLTPEGGWVTVRPGEGETTEDYPGMEFYDDETNQRVTGALVPGRLYSVRNSGNQGGGVPVNPAMENAKPGEQFRVRVGTGERVSMDDIDPRFGVRRVVTPDGRIYDSQEEIDSLGGYIPPGSTVDLYRLSPTPEDLDEQYGDPVANIGLVTLAAQINAMTPAERFAFANSDEGRAAQQALIRAGYGFDTQWNVTSPSGERPMNDEPYWVDDPRFDDTGGGYWVDPATGNIWDEVDGRWISNSFMHPAEEPVATGPLSDADRQRLEDWADHLNYMDDVERLAWMDTEEGQNVIADLQAAGYTVYEDGSVDRPAPAAGTSPDSSTDTTTASAATTPTTSSASASDSILEWLVRDYPERAIVYPRDGSYMIIDLPPGSGPTDGSRTSDFPDGVQIYEVYTKSDGTPGARKLVGDVPLDNNKHYQLRITKSDARNYEKKHQQRRRG